MPAVVRVVAVGVMGMLAALAGFGAARVLVGSERPAPALLIDLDNLPVIESPPPAAEPETGGIVVPPPTLPPASTPPADDDDGDDENDDADD